VQFPEAGRGFPAFQPVTVPVEWQHDRATEQDDDPQGGFPEDVFLREQQDWQQQGYQG
jgi:hypothetical protein